ncbi:PAP2 superfamily protein [Maridesulfovibrio ferrireducens]|uniref:PAP2 superfamily protein n=1 Tax=Maridesulfovibrio ferrireducens TaxID=246191 RepID=A0A1G9KNG3_9BACT|nr:phosphatase PAP2 family protein [Maridesulfovibrio ferrireducens]SDL50945.1 PAP2 superfamily protein [Maridesulfovibrio ferrireducens]
MFRDSDKLGKLTIIIGILTLISIVLFYQLLDLPIAKGAHALKGSFLVTLGKGISALASEHVVQTITFATLLTGVCDAVVNGQSMRSRSLLFIALATGSAMLIGDELKWFFARCRPLLFFEDGSYGFTWFSDKYLKHSFPSGHTLRAFSLTCSVALLLPKRRCLPLILAVLIGLSRVVVGKHYPSDVIFGAFIGMTCAAWSYYFIFKDTRCSR